MDAREELRCFCSMRPLLAVYGIKDGKPYVHVKVYKQGRVYGEVFLDFGKMRIKCRDCYRIHTVNIKKGSVQVDPVAK